jgi:predicted nuclease of restriction endonuclease-like (RecB) superfamily
VPETGPAAGPVKVQPPVALLWGEWGEAAIAEQLASDLRRDFPGVAGYSRRNIFYMREFYLAYRDLPKVQPLVAQIGWTQNLTILQRGMFAFMGSQFCLEVAGEVFFIDLLLFHRRLKCLVAIELKIGRFQPEYIGKMQFYLTALDRQMREDGENPSIGIILCKEKNRTIVEYALHDVGAPIGVATYRTVQSLPKELKGQFPAPEDIARLFEEAL